MPNTINLKNVSPENEEKRGMIFAAAPRRRWKIKFAAAAFVVLALAWIGSITAHATKWKAVFLTNNQVYFGHFWNWPFASAITLNDVYYLQVNQSGQQLNTQDQSQLKLVRLGSEIHGPTGQMVIPFSQILFWETLRDDSAIVGAIKNFQSKNQN